MLAKKVALFTVGYLRAQHRPRSPRTVGNLVAAQRCFCAVMREDPDAQARRITRCMIGANTANTIVIDLALGIVAAEDPDAE